MSRQFTIPLTISNVYANRRNNKRNYQLIELYKTPNTTQNKASYTHRYRKNTGWATFTLT